MDLADGTLKHTILSRACFPELVNNERTRALVRVQDPMQHYDPIPEVSDLTANVPTLKGCHILRRPCTCSIDRALITCLG